MSLWQRLRSLIRASVRRGDLERRMQHEMREHIDMLEADLRSRGLSAEEAHRRARAAFGSLDARKDECRQSFGLRLLGEVRGDVVYALRLLRRSPVFTAVALLSLGLGVGANVAIFSLIDTVMLRSLPVRDPQRLFFVDDTGGRSDGGNTPPYPCFELLRDHNRFLDGISAFSMDVFKVTIDGVPEQVRGQNVSGNYFDLLGIRAVHGRLLTPADDSVMGRGGEDGAVAVISYAFWERRFGLDPAVLGKTVQVGRHWVTIVGVTEPQFFGLQVGSPMDISVPMMLAGDVLGSKSTWWMSSIARVRREATVEQARADLDAIFDAFMVGEGQPREKRSYFSHIELVPAVRGGNDLRRDFQQPLLIIMAIVSLVLLIGCANVASLLVARASARRGEIAVRLAIGAGRGRLIRQLLTEGAVLVSLGTVGGVVFASWGARFLANAMSGPGRGIVLEPAFDGRVIAFTAGLAALTALLFSLAPAIHATGADSAKPSSSGITRRFRTPLGTGRVLLVVQVMLSAVLLTGAALFVRTLHQLRSVDAGFDRAGVLSMQVEAAMPPSVTKPPPDESRREHARLGEMWQELADRASGLPGVTSAAVGTLSPLVGRDRGVRLAIAGGGSTSERDTMRDPADFGVKVNQVSSGFFSTAAVRLVSGRVFTPADRAGSLRVAIMNENAARWFFGTETPVGRRINFPGQRIEDEYEIVGVVGNVRYRDLRTADGRMVYLPITQAIDRVTSLMLAVRGGRGEVTALTASVRKTAETVIPGGFVSRVGTIEQRVDASLVRERLLSILATFFAGLALALACIGLYGVMAYGVVRRTREIGVRLAIGANRRAVVWMILRETIVLVAIGAALGTAAAAVAGRQIRSQLFGVAPGDSVAALAAALVLLTMTLAAGSLPARRASRIDPVVALRHE
jgi:predicted permease